MRRFTLTCVIAILVGQLLAGCAAPESIPTRFEFSEMTMGVKARMVLYAPNEQAAREAARAAFDRMHDLDDVMSDWRADTEVALLHEAPAGVPIPVSEDLWDVISLARDISEATGGAFDITVGPVVRLWREAHRTGEFPRWEPLRQALALVGWQRIEMEQSGRLVALAEPGMRLDLGGIGKGFAADHAVAVLRDHGVRNALIDLGGDLRVTGHPPGRSAWLVSVLTGDARDPRLSLALTDAAVATSGDTEQFVEIGGKRYSHIVDPRTGIGLTDRAAATVVAPTAALADALASALCVAGPDRAADIIGAFGVEGRLTSITAEGRVQVGQISASSDR